MTDFSQNLSEFVDSLPSLEAMEAEERRREDLKRRQITGLDIASSLERCKGLAGFVREAWHVVEPTEIYVHNWHIEAICEHLEAVTYGQISRLLINVPPGMMKSLLVSVLWPAWEWGPAGLPSNRIVSTSYQIDYVTRDSRRMRDLVLSEWYQERWLGTRLTRYGETSFSNVATGWREGMPFKSLTGSRGHRVIIDDPHSTEMAESETERKSTTRVFRESVPSRLVDPRTSAIVIIMQRLHVEDVSGVCQALRLGYEHLMLPMEFEPDRRCHTSIGFKDPRTYDGELLFQERFPREVVERDKVPMGSYAVAGQFQQRPTLREGGMFKRGWFRPIKAAAPGTRWVRRWDFAASLEIAGSDPAYTAGIKLGRQPDGRFVVGHAIRERDEGIGIRKLVKDTATLDGEHVEIGIPQDPGQAGKVQAQDYVLQLAGYVVRAMLESGDKATRAAPFAAQAEAGNVDLVVGEWNEAFLDEVTNFPGGKFKDQVDALSGAFSMLIGAGVFTAPEDSFTVDPKKIPDVWGRIAAVVVDDGKVGAVWGAIDRLADKLYILDEYAVPMGQMALHAEAIRKRGAWIPTLFEFLEGGRKDESARIATVLAELSVNIYTVPLDEASGVEAIVSRLGRGALQVFNTCPNWLAQYRRYRRNDKGEIEDDGDVLMRATALLALHAEDTALSEGEWREPPSDDYAPQDGRSRTGY